MNLKSAQIIYTTPFPARFGTRETHTYTWKNETSDTFHIAIAQVWLGMDIGGKGDFWFTLSRKSDNAILGVSNWDHYSEPSSAEANIYRISYSPNTMDVEPNDSLILECGARRWLPFWPITMRGDASVTIWYLT